jgi:hypothetical protein
MQVALALTIFMFALGSGSIVSATPTASKLRWIGLFVVCVLALLLVVERRRMRLPDAWVYWSVGALGVLVLASAAWSVNPRLSVERGVSFVVLLVAAAALGVAVAGDPDAVDAILIAIVAAAVAVSAAGAILFAFASNDAVQWGTAATPLRFQGIGQNPNTVAMLAALATPLALRYVLAPAAVGRTVGAAAFVALYATVVASGSRGALLASFVGLMLVAVLLHERWGLRLATGTAVVGLLLGGVFVTDALLRGVQSPSAAATPASTSAPASPAAAHSPAPAAPSSVSSAGNGWTNQLPRMEDEIGSSNAAADAQQRRLFGASGRVAAWRGALHQAEKRPLFGFGFGTEERVFVDRYYAFEGARPENSYIGLFLQLGVVGVVLFLSVGVALVAALMRGTQTARATTAAAAGAVLAGFALGVGQSYVYSVGNIATVSFWMCALLLAAAASAVTREPVARREAAAVRV